MKLKFKNKTSPKRIGRVKKKARIRSKITGTGERPRLCVYRSLRYISAQVVDDSTSKTLFSLSSKNLPLKSKANAEAAQALGKELATLAKKNNVSQVVFDRNGFLYHGCVKAFADAVREGGVQF